MSIVIKLSLSLGHTTIYKAFHLNFQFLKCGTANLDSASGGMQLSWVVDGPPGATGVLSGRGGRKRGPLLRSINEVMHLMQGCHCALLQKLCEMPKSQTLNPSGAEF